MVSNTYYQHGVYIDNIGVILYKQMCTQRGSPFLLPYLGYNMTYEHTIHIRNLWQLLTKHLTHMAYISKPLVRKLTCV